MPRSKDQSQTKNPLHQWTDVSIGLMKKVHQDKLPQFPFLVLLCLKTFAWDGQHAFPSLETIADRLGMDNKSRIQQVCNALKKLEDLGYIKRNDRRQKPDRFVLKPINSVVKYEATSNTQERERKQTQDLNTLILPQTPCETRSSGAPVNNNASASTLKEQAKEQRRNKRTLRRNKRTRTNPVAERIRLEVLALEERERLHEEYKRTLPERTARILDQMDGLHSQHTPATSNERTKQFYATQTLFYQGLIPDLTNKGNVSWMDFSTWILKHIEDEWLDVLPPHPDVLELLKLHLE